MAYVCANCGADLLSKKALAEHMVEKHSSPFLEGDNDLIKFSYKHAKKINESTSLRKIEEAGIEVA